jgi:hypothetical protein
MFLLAFCTLGLRDIPSKIQSSVKAEAMKLWGGAVRPCGYFNISTPLLHMSLVPWYYCLSPGTRVRLLLYPHIYIYIYKGQQASIAENIGLDTLYIG